MPVLACRRCQVEDRHAGRFAAGSGGRRNRDQRLQRPRHRQASADGRVDIVEKVRRRIGRVQVGGLRGVDRGPAADGDVRVVGARARECDRLEERGIGGLDADADYTAANETPCCSSESRTVRTGGSPPTSGSVNTSTWRAPISFRSIPTSRVTPTPKRTGRRPFQTQCPCSWSEKHCRSRSASTR